MNNNENYDLMVIGGGAAGCFAAMTAAETGARVLIVERNDRLMLKMGITGKGRCNITNHSDNDEIIKNLPINGRFLHSALSDFGSSDTQRVFESLGVKLKIERGGRVFPVSDKASDIVGAVKKRLSELGVTIIKDRIIEILTKSGKAVGAKGEKDCYYSNSIILATGGKSYPKTGSSGDGYDMALKLGHKITPIRPALIPILIYEDFSASAGLTLKNVTLKLYDRESRNLKKPIFNEMGEMLITHTGISGPLVLSLSVFIKSNNFDRYYSEIDLKPALSAEKLEDRIIREFSEFKNKDIKNALRSFLPESLIVPFLEYTEIPINKKVNEINKSERQSIIKSLKALRLNIKGFRDIEEAIITDGGICINEINPSTMESRIIKHLFFAGEIIDVIGFTGGFNLQVALTTGYAAGKNGVLV